MTGASARAESAMMGILNIDKPYGMTSMDVTRRIKRAAGLRRGVGHAGTLDPIATGVLPICVGRATRVIEYLVDDSKEYVAGIALGIATDTYDALGETTAERDASAITRERFEAALEAFRGEILQTPPMHSAIKRQGKRLYELARAGVEVEREARAVVVHHLALTDWRPPLATVEITCGKGFYVRSLAHDLGEALGCGAHMRSLSRRRAGAFHIDDAIGLDDAVERIERNDLSAALHPPDAALASMPSMVLDDERAAAFRNGRPLPPDASPNAPSDGQSCRAYGADGAFLGIARYDAARRRWLPRKVFAR